MEHLSKSIVANAERIKWIGEFQRETMEESFLIQRRSEILFNLIHENLLMEQISLILDRFSTAIMDSTIGKLNPKIF